MEFARPWGKFTAMNPLALNCVFLKTLCIQGLRELIVGFYVDLREIVFFCFVLFLVVTGSSPLCSFSPVFHLAYNPSFPKGIIRNKK